MAKNTTPRVYSAVVYIGTFRTRLLCIGLTKVQAREDAVLQAMRIWPISGKRAKIGGLQWQKNLSAQFIRPESLKVLAARG